LIDLVVVLFYAMNAWTKPSIAPASTVSQGTPYISVIIEMQLAMVALVNLTKCRATTEHEGCN
jgi:hypothetical protein